jgi:hypothetical protein
MAPDRISRIDWDDSRVDVGMMSEPIAANPEYDPSNSNDTSFELRSAA